MKMPRILLAPFLLGSASALDLYNADFSVAGQGSTHDNAADPIESSPINGENWTVFWNENPASDSTTNRFITQDGLLISDDWGGEAFFETDEIDVSGETTVNIVASGETRGVDVFNNTNLPEKFQWYYILDGVRTDGPEITADGSLDFSETVDVSGASTLKVGFTFNINGSNDGFEIASVEVNDGVATPKVSLSIAPASLSENGGMATVTVDLTAAPAASLTLNLEIDDTSEASVPASVTIPSGANTANFQVTGVDDTIADGPQIVTLTAVDPGGVYEGASETFAVTDNEPFSPPAVILNEIRINATNQVEGNGEYFELKSSQSNVSLNRLFLVAIGDGTSTQGSGVVEEIVDLTGQTMNGTLFVAADPAQNFVPETSIDYEVPLNFENDNVTFILVSDFTASLGDDLDADDDGMLDSEPWGQLLDSVSLVNSLDPSDPDDLVYADTLTPEGLIVGPDSTFIPAHVYRPVSNPSSWSIGLFFVNDPGNADTPGQENDGGDPVVETDLVINSFTIDVEQGTGVINATGLGTKIWTVETSLDFGQSDPWGVLNGVFETDPNDGSGSTNFNFTFSPGPEETARFFRLVEVPQ